MNCSLKWYVAVILPLVYMFVACSNDSKSTLTATDATWSLTWSDEFDTPEIDRTKWDFDLGNGFWFGDSWISGWGNNELECYTERTENVRSENGYLVITAIQESYECSGQMYSYTSARLKTKGLFSQTYGKFEARIKLPIGKGLWPAFWMLPKDEVYGSWAASGEIDIMEARGSDPTSVSGAIHYGGQWPNNVYTVNRYGFPMGESTNEFHVYAVEWEPGEIRWYVDDRHYATQNEWYSYSPNQQNPNPFPAPFDQDFYLLLNSAIGGNYDGNPDSHTTFPQSMKVDYVRVYNK